MVTIYSKKIIDYRIEYMKNIRISLIAAFYKDLTALELIINSLRKQNYNNFELIVAEDNDDQATRVFLATIKDIDIIHTTQADQGIQKARSLNNAILASTGDYLVFIDADCIPGKNFLQAHASLAETGKMLIGRCVNLGPRMSNLLRSRKLNIRTIERYYLFFLPLLLLDGATHIEQGLAFNPRGWVKITPNLIFFPAKISLENKIERAFFYSFGQQFRTSVNS